MAKEDRWLFKNIPAILQLLKHMLAALGLLLIMAAQLWPRGLSLVLIAAVLEKALTPARNSAQTLARAVFTECGKMVKLEQAKGDTRLARGMGGVVGGAVGGAMGGAVHTFLSATLPSFEPFGVALAIVLGRIFGKSVTAAILNETAITDIAGQLGGAMGAAMGSMIGGVSGSSGLVFCFMTGGVVGGLMGGAIGAVGVSYLGNWVQEKFISVLSAMIMGLIITLHGVIGLLGSLAAVTAMLVVMHNKQDEAKGSHTSTDGNEKERDDSSQDKIEPKVDIKKHFEAMGHLQSLLAAVGLVAILSAGAVGALIIIILAVAAVILHLYSKGHASKTLSRVTAAVEKEFGTLNEYLKNLRGKMGAASAVDTELFVNPCSIGGIIGGTVGGTVGGTIKTLLTMHPVLGQAFGGALGARIGWTLGKAFTSDMLRNGPPHEWVAGAIGGTFGGVTGASFGFFMGGVGGGLAGGVMGLVCDKYLMTLKKID